MAIDLAIYTVLNSSYSSPQVGVIQGNLSGGAVLASTITVKFNNATYGPDPGGSDPTVSTDPKVYAYPKNPKDVVANIVFERYYYGRNASTPSAPVPPYTSVISAFDSSNLVDAATLTSALNNSTLPPATPSFLTGWGGSTTTQPDCLVVNAYGIVRFDVTDPNNDFLYMISFDVARITKIDPNTKCVLSAANYTVASPNQAKGQAIKIHNGKLYALFIVADEAFANYQPSVVAEIDTANFGSANTFINTCTVGKNAVKLESGGPDMYVACIGGMQQGGSSNACSVLNKITVGAGGALASCVVYTNDSATYDIRDIAISSITAPGASSPNVLILRGANTAGWAAYTYQVGRTTLADLLTAAATAGGVPISNVFDPPDGTIDSNPSGVGAFYSLTYENAYKHFWCELGDNIVIFNDADVPNAPDTGIGAPAQQLNSTALYGSACVINSLCVFIDCTSAYNPPVAGPMRAVVSNHDPSSPEGQRRKPKK